MPNFQLPFRLHTIMLAIGALGAWGAVQAQTVSSTISGVGTDTTASTVANSVAPGSPFASSYQYRTSDSGTDNASTAYTFAHANDTGSFGAKATGSGIFDASASFSYSTSITNTAATAQSAAFSFYIYGGQVSAYGANDPGEFARSQVSYDIRLDGSSAWSSSAFVDMSNLGTSHGTSGVNIYSAFDGSGYGINGGTYTLNLGILQPNQTITLSYDMLTTASSNAPGTWITGGGGGYYGYGYGDGYGGLIGGGYGYGGYLSGAGGAGASSADPFEVSWGPGNVGGDFVPPVVSFSSPVPEPETYAMMLVGLGILGASARRRRSRG